ncbi:unnamed protein product [Cuscuta campestris]|uniref:Uncharacterized protein n=1 Tax=Cuscuta campestris TaxID=132261 RepID=A0A484NAJ8_9ASTE|nr:unnamed protein product [Cuscuta campestris]
MPRERRSPESYGFPGRIPATHHNRFYTTNTNPNHKQSILPQAKKLFSQILHEDGNTVMGKIEGSFNGMPSATFTLDEERKLERKMQFALVGRGVRFINLITIKSFLEGTGFQGGSSFIDSSTTMCFLSSTKRKNT